MIAAVMTTLEHLDRCATCHRRTLHRRIVMRDESGVVSDVRDCMVCANRAAGADGPASPVLAMKEARSIKRKLRAQPVKKRRKLTGQA
jgi:hypothetical protein